MLRARRTARLLSVDCTLGYEVQGPRANFTFNNLASRDPFQHVLDESIRRSPDLPTAERPASSAGNRVFRVEVPAGPLAVDERTPVDEAAGG